MAEPERSPQRHPEVEPDIRPNLHVIEGGGETTPDRGNLQSVDSPARDLRDQERKFGAIDGGGESTPDRGNLSAADDVRESEQTGGGWQNNYTGQNRPQKFNLKTTLRKKGPIGLIIALLGGGGLAIGGLLSPSLLLVQIKTVFTNDRSDATPAIQTHADILLKNKVRSLNATFGVCGNTVNIRCKIGTMSNRQLKRFERAGFQVQTEKKFGRNVIRSLTLPDGRKVESPQHLENLLKEPQVAAAFQSVFNVATPFVSSFFTNVLAKMKLTKAAKIAGSKRDQVRESMRNYLGVDGDGKYNTKFGSAVGKARSLANQAGKAAGVEIACLAYNLSRTTVNGIKVTKGAALATFALGFLIAADQILAGDADPEVISTLGTQLTSTNADPDDPTYGLAATDSTMFKTALFGDSNALPAYAAAYLLGGSKIAEGLSDFVKTIDDLAGGRANVKTVCKIARGAGLLGCVAGLAGVAGCAAMYAFIGPFILEPLLGAAVERVIKEGSELDLNDKTVGVKAGDAIGVGAGVILGKMAQSIGSKPSNKSEVQQFIADTSEVREREIAVQRYNAQSEPLNVYNPHSFMGAIATNLRLSTFSSSSVSNNIASLFSMIPASIAGATNANASVYMPVAPYSDRRFEQCDDPELESIGVDGDIDCGVRFTQSGRSLYMDSDVNLDYMISNGHIDENDLTGAAKSDDYKKFIRYCGKDRDEFYGSTGNAIEDGDRGDEDWFSGKKCREDSDMITNFTTFTSRNEVDTMMDEEAPTNDTGTVTPSGEWANPGGSPDKYTISSPYGPRSRGFHDGIDLAYNGDFYAACSGKITNVDNKGDTNQNGVSGSSNVITVDCGDGIVTKYLHYYYRDIGPEIRVGNNITAGTKIAKVGNQGNSSGPHLHFQIEQNGKTIDPEPFMQRVGAPLR